jgi:hypothetical protein
VSVDIPSLMMQEAKVGTRGQVATAALRALGHV